MNQISLGIQKLQNYGTWHWYLGKLKGVQKWGEEKVFLVQTFDKDNLMNHSLSLEKTFFPITANIFVHLLTLFSVCKRILVLVVFFVPSFGLFRLLVHWNNEKVPFAVRQNRNISSDDILLIFGKSSVLWSEVDR